MVPESRETRGPADRPSGAVLVSDAWKGSGAAADGYGFCSLAQAALVLVVHAVRSPPLYVNLLGEPLAWEDVGWSYGATAKVGEPSRPI